MHFVVVVVFNGKTVFSLKPYSQLFCVLILKLCIFNGSP